VREGNDVEQASEERELPSHLRRPRGERSLDDRLNLQPVVVTQRRHFRNECD
jgi:hypothetical protein